MNLIIAGKRGISPDMAKALGKALDVSADYFANLQQMYVARNRLDETHGNAIAIHPVSRFAPNRAARHATPPSRPTSPHPSARHDRCHSVIVAARTYPQAQP